MGSDAKILYLDCFLSNVQKFNHPVELIGDEYNSSVRHNQVKNVLNTLLLQDKLSENQYAGIQNNHEVGIPSS